MRYKRSFYLDFWQE